MRAITISEPGGPEVLRWEEVPDPEPQPGEVLIAITATAVNRADIMQRQGHYPPPPGAPPYPGLECSGVTADGEPVCALLAGGGYAEKVAVPAGQTLPIPDGVSVTDAAALPEVACTVWSNVVDIARLSAGETLLVHGGGSGIGTFAIQLGKALGARVITTARAGKHEALRRLGADETIDYTTDWVSRVKNQADVILDIMGAAYLAKNIEALAKNGRIATIGLQGGRAAELNLQALMGKRGSISATTLRARPAAEKAAIVRGVREQVWPLVARGAIKPVVDRTFPLADAAAAHRRVEASDHIGKVLLTSS